MTSTAAGRERGRPLAPGPAESRAWVGRCQHQATPHHPRATKTPHPRGPSRRATRDSGQSWMESCRAIPCHPGEPGAIPARPQCHAVPAPGSTAAPKRPDLHRWGSRAVRSDAEARRPCGATASRWIAAPPSLITPRNWRHQNSAASPRSWPSMPSRTTRSKNCSRVSVP